MKDFLEPYLRRSPTSTTLRVGTNNSINHSSSAILNKLLSLKYFNTVHLSMNDSNQNLRRDTPCKILNE